MSDLLNALAAGQEEMMGKGSPTAVWPQPEQPHNGAERGDDTAVAPLQFVTVDLRPFNRSSVSDDVPPLNCVSSISVNQPPAPLHTNHAYHPRR